MYSEPCIESPCAGGYADANKCGTDRSPDTKEEFALLKQFAKVRVLSGKHIDINGKTVHEWRFLEIAHTIKDKLGSESVIWHQDHACDEVIEVLLAGK